MKIGIISSWRDALALFKFLSHYENNYLVYVDQNNYPYEEKSFSKIVSRINEVGEFLIEKWAEWIILDPIYELALKHFWKDGNFNVIPLFQTYLQDYVYKYSLVGKIWVLTDFWSSSEVQKLLETEEKYYEPTGEQRNIKKFSFPFHYRVKIASSWVANIYDLWVHSPYLIRMLKNDLRYFKDAYVDTVVPMHYHYFRAQRTIKSFFNFNKTRFHDLAIVEECFRKLCKSWSDYSVEIWINDSKDFLLRDKQLLRDIQRGKNIAVKIEEI